MSRPCLFPPPSLVVLGWATQASCQLHHRSRFEPPCSSKSLTSSWSLCAGFSLPAFQVQPNDCGLPVFCGLPESRNLLHCVPVNLEKALGFPLFRQRWDREESFAAYLAALSVAGARPMRLRPNPVPRGLPRCCHRRRRCDQKTTRLTKQRQNCLRHLVRLCQHGGSGLSHDGVSSKLSNLLGHVCITDG